MERLINLTVGLIEAIKRAYTKKWSFFGVFALAFLLSVLTLARFDLLPDVSTIQAASAQDVVIDSSTISAPTPVVAEAELPLSIEIPKIKLSVSISNPTSTDIETLDRYLLKGSVRYPSSAKLGEIGNVVLFGHSSYLPIVRNQAYKAFNDIQKLSAGDIVTVYSSSTAYTYRVRSVRKESTTNAGIPLDVTGRVLTLSTCDSFGEKTDRFVLTADFVESHPVST